MLFSASDGELVGLFQREELLEEWERVVHGCTEVGLQDREEPERRHQLQTEAAALAVDVGGCLLVTSARFAQRNGRGREGKRADRQTVHRSKSRVGHGGKEIEVAGVCLSDHLAPYRKPFWDFTVGFQWWQRDTLETLFAVDQHTFMITQAAEQMRFDFVLLDFGIIHSALSRT